MSIVKTTTTKTEDEDGSRSGHVRPTTKRAVPFLGSLLIAFVVLPLVHATSRGIALLDPLTGALLGQGWTITGAGLAVVALAVGLFRRRVTFVIVHVAVTVFAIGVSISMTTGIGWHYRLWDVFLFFGTLILWGSWMLYRIDAFRAAATGNSDGGWGEIIGLMRSRPRLVKDETDAHHIVVDVEHGDGETHDSVRSAAKKLESAGAAMSGGTTVIPGDRANVTRLSFEMADAFFNWRPYPGPSHPGQSFVHPFRTAYYSTGKDQWFSFAATVGYDSPVAQGFVSEMDSFLGLVGVTGSGKSGELNLLAAEGLSRSDCIVVWLDKEKFLQNCGWASDMLGMGGNGESADGTPSNAADFNKALRELGRYRVGVFGQVALDAVMSDDGGLADDIGRKWSPELARETGEAAVLALVDEADTAIQSENWKWLAARGRSLGIFLVPATPRASTAEVPAIVRGSVGMWKTFAVGDGYSQGFSISQKTEDAGADPTTFRAPGLHYLDRAPGVDPRMWPVKSRTFKHTTKLLRRMVLQARESFTPMGFSDGAIAAMGEYYFACHPRVVMKLETAESLMERFEQGLPLAGDVPERVLDSPFDAEDTMPRELLQRFVQAMAAGQLGGTPDEVETARRILAANGQEVPVSPAPAGSAPVPPPKPPAAVRVVRRRDEGDVDETEEEGMSSSATGTDVEAGVVRTVDLRKAGIGDEDLEREMAAADPYAPIITGHDGPSIRLDAEDPDRPRWSAEDTAAELDRVIVEFAEGHKKRFSNAEAMAAMRCEISAVTMTRRLYGLAESERIIPPGLKLEKDPDRNGSWLIVRSRPSPHPR